MGTMIRVSVETHAALRELSRDVGVPMADIVAEAIVIYRRERLIDAINAGYAALRRDPAASAEEQTEREAWDTTLADRLENY